MPSQQVEVAEAIAGIKRALKRQREGMTILSILVCRNQCTDGAPLQRSPINLWPLLQIEETSFDTEQNLYTKDL